LATPETNADRIDNLHDGLIANGLAPDGKDPGQKGVTRYLRLPEGVNTKAKRIAESGGTAPRCEITEWHPDRRYTLEQLAEPFGVDLDAPRTTKPDGAATVSDHPLINIPDIIHIKEIRSDGRFDITCPWVDEHTGAADDGAAMFTNADGSIGFKCHHGSCEGRTGGDLLQWIEEQQPGFSDQLKQWQVMRELGSVATNETGGDMTTPSVSITMSARDLLKKAAVTKDDVMNMKAQMLADSFALEDVALNGQWTHVWASPGTGKTLLLIWLIREAIEKGLVRGDQVYLAEMDDNHIGGLTKADIAAQIGFQILIPGNNDFRADDLIKIMQALVDENDAAGFIIIADTIKKLTSVMSKDKASQFGKLARLFVAAGGTLVTLGHTNKYKSEEGKSVFSGVQDFMVDSDCCWMIGTIGEEEGLCSTTFAVEFENLKDRGDMPRKIAFRYTKNKGATYLQLLNTVERLDHSTAMAIQESQLNLQEQQQDAEVITAIQASIENLQMNKTQIENFVNTLGKSKQKTRRVLDKYTGRLWNLRKGENNASIYSLNDPPIAPVVSFF